MQELGPHHPQCPGYARLLPAAGDHHRRNPRDVRYGGKGPRPDGGLGAPGRLACAMIDSEAKLRELYGHASGLSVQKSRPGLDKYSRQFIAMSPFLVLSTANAKGKADVTPRGDPPGFVHVIDDRSFLIPDRPGNNRLDTMVNIVENPNVGCLFFIPGFEDTLRVAGPGADHCRSRPAQTLHRRRQSAQGRRRGGSRGSLPPLRQGAEAVEALARRLPAGPWRRCRRSPASFSSRPARPEWMRTWPPPRTTRSTKITGRNFIDVDQGLGPPNGE